MKKEDIVNLTQLQARIDALELEIVRLATCEEAILSGQKDCTVSFPNATIGFSVGALVPEATQTLYGWTVEMFREELKRLSEERDRLVVCVNEKDRLVPTEVLEVD